MKLFPQYKSKTLTDKPFNQYTDEELYKILEKNENTDLAGICSEILLRQSRRGDITKFTPDSSEAS